MHKNFSKIVNCWFLIFLSAKPCKAFICDKALHLALIYPCDDQVNPQVKLEAIHEQGLVQVLLNDHAILDVWRHLPHFFEQNDAVSLRSTLGLCNVHIILGLVFFEVLLESFCVLGKNERGRHKFEALGRDVPGDDHHILKNVLSTELLDVWVPANNLLFL